VVDFFKHQGNGKMKKPTVKMITPSAKAGVMQPKFRGKAEKPKKGKGSYHRPKIKGEQE